MYKTQQGMLLYEENNLCGLDLNDSHHCKWLNIWLILFMNFTEQWYKSTLMLSLQPLSFNTEQYSFTS